MSRAAYRAHRVPVPKYNELKKMPGEEIYAGLHVVDAGNVERGRRVYFWMEPGVLPPKRGKAYVMFGDNYRVVQMHRVRLKRRGWMVMHLVA